MIVSLVLIKAYLGIPTATTTHDDFLTEQGGFVSDVVEAYCRRHFTVAKRSQTFYNDSLIAKRVQGPYIELFNYPLTAVDSVHEDGVLLDPSEYIINKLAGFVVKKQGTFIPAEETIVVYDSGFAVLPSPVKNTVLSIVQERYNKKNAGIDLNFGSDVQRISIPGSISIDFDYSLSNNERATPFGSVIGSHTNILDYYRSDRAVVGEDKLIFIEDV